MNVVVSQAPIIRTATSAGDRDGLQNAAEGGLTVTASDVDYRNVLVRKPWGHEYLLFENESTAAWILCMKRGHSTSMHCHVGKSTALVVLEGEVCCQTFAAPYLRRAGQGVMLERRVFHQTFAMPYCDVVLLEVESPPAKHDLVRLRDAYGRASKPYEGTANHEKAEPGCRTCEVDRTKGPFSFYKDFGSTAFEIADCDDDQLRRKLCLMTGMSIVCLLGGRAADQEGIDVIPVGHAVTASDFSRVTGVHCSNATFMFVTSKPY